MSASRAAAQWTFGFPDSGFPGPKGSFQEGTLAKAWSTLPESEGGRPLLHVGKCSRVSAVDGKRQFRSQAHAGEQTKIVPRQRMTSPFFFE